MNLSTFPDAVADYERITGETVNRNPANDGLSVLMPTIDGEPTNEFMLWKICEMNGEPSFWIDQTMGQVKHFAPFIRTVCQQYGIEIVATATARDPKAHLRKWKMIRVPEHDYEFNGRHYFALKGNIKNLK